MQSGRRDLNPRPSTWEVDALPLSYFRKALEFTPLEPLLQRGRASTSHVEGRGFGFFPLGKLSSVFFDLSQIAVRDAYKLLTGVVVPRPIALVTSVSQAGIVNAAPYSFFNLLGSDPPIIAIGVGDRAPGVGKDTARNLEASGEFVVNIVDEALAQAMNDCATDFPPDWSEVEALGLAVSGGKTGQIVRVPRLLDAPASLECRHHSSLQIGRNRIVLGEVVGLWVRDEFVNPEKFHVATKEMRVIGRGGGGNEGGYFRLHDTFTLPRQTFGEWQAEHGGGTSEERVSN